MDIDDRITAFILSQGDTLGWEAFQTYFGMVGNPRSLETWRCMPANMRVQWEEVTTAVLEDFAVWLTTHPEPEA